MNENLHNLLEYTNVSVFLTGKAGTGKTTFLRDYVQKTRKNFIITAPTGIASVNAGGTTIHSLFKLPLRTFVPTTENANIGDAININELSLKFKYDKNRLSLLRKLELLIIDEVSMLRADLLDMIDFALRHVRKNSKPFGGVQILFIGDLYQLPPVVKEDSEQILSRFYDSPFFFSAKALQNITLFTIELDKVYRQTDLEFLDILDSIRNSDVDKIDFKKLNSRYIPDFEPQEEAYIYLCSHNKNADDINKKKLSELKEKSLFYKASISGELNVHQLPNDEVLELKVGSQVMFIRNDASYEKKFYNGKLAKISYLDQNKIKVILENSDEEIVVEKEVWRQNRYVLAEDNKIKEEIQGSFIQYPIRLAWAVTIHKSQGLTFDRMIVDAGESFASGQVYVALSRCRTLEGIVLKSEISPKIIFGDSRVDEFQEKTKTKESLADIIEREKYPSALRKLTEIMGVLWLKEAIISWKAQAYSYEVIDKNEIDTLSGIVLSKIKNLIDVFSKFENVIEQKYLNFLDKKTSWEEIENKCKGAVGYFHKDVFENIFIPFSSLYFKNRKLKDLKAYNKKTKDFLQDIETYLENIRNIHLLEKPMFTGNKREKNKIIKIKENPSQIITFQMFKGGKTSMQIAKERGLVLSTVFGHLAEFASLGLLERDDMEKILGPNKIKIFENQYDKQVFDNLTDWKRILPDNFEFHEIRILWNYFKNINET